ncbi:uncharacterized protein LOC143287615 [Babylonia areolata]|uniref:uncharacterized protein LOC143287615 n=1 Tax=Babylonia areolata TaxID=304850 RepID=UPI003FD3AAC9
MPQQLPPFMVTPPCMELKESLVASKAQGVFCKEPISVDSKFGPFVGEIITKDELDKKEKDIDYRFAWQVSDNKTSQILHVVNATVPEKGNWMRYVKSARFFEEQNIMSVQEGSEIFYKALKDIKPGEELLTWFETTSTTRKRKRESRSLSTPSVEVKGQAEQSATNAELVGNGKRLRKKKISEDMVPLDHDDVIFASSGHHHNRIRTNNSSVRRRTSSIPDSRRVSSQRMDSHKNRIQTSVNKMAPGTQPVRKTLVTTSQQTSDLGVNNLLQTSNAQFPQPKVIPPLKGAKRPKSILQIVDFLKSSKEQTNGTHDSEESDSTRVGDKPMVSFSAAPRPKQKRSGLVGTAEYMEEHMITDFQFLFEVTAAHKSLPKSAPKRMRYACDICEGQYRKALSLKRHILREHLNHKYLSPEDTALLNHKTAMSTARIEADVDPDADDVDVSDSSDSNSSRIRSDSKDEDVESLQIKEEMIESHTPANTHTQDSSTPADVKSGVADDSVAKAKPKVDRAALEKSLTSKAMEGKKTFSYSGVDSVNDAFRCHLCVQLFPSVEKLKHHLTNDAHRSKGNKQFGCDRCNQRFRFRHNYQRHLESHGLQTSELSTACSICHKRFMNEANMRKHLRFHSGRNFPCKYGCTNVCYPNVAELVKHLRRVHPDLPKRSQVALTNMASKLSGQPVKSNETSPSASPVPLSNEPAPYRTEAEAIQEFEATHPEGWTETRGRKPQKEMAGKHCTICKKLFSTYGSMCRHRRSVHRVVKMSGKFVKVAPTPSSLPPFQLEEEEAPSWDDAEARRTLHIEAKVEKIYEEIEKEEAVREGTEYDFAFSPPPSPTSFYQNVADNIAENLSCYLDGGSEALKTAQRYIKVDDYVPLDEAEGIQSQNVDIDWSAYNFPPFFLPVDPVVPLPRSPPAPPPNLKGTLLSLDGDKTLAYPTRSAVAEREATRRGSVGAADNSVMAERERIPRRASVGSLDKMATEGHKIVRRASMGSFENQKITGTSVTMTSTPDSQGTHGSGGAENPQEGKTESQKTQQVRKECDEVFDSQSNVNNDTVGGSESASGSENDNVSGAQSKDVQEKAETVVFLKLRDENENKDKQNSESSCADSGPGQNVCGTKASLSDTEDVRRSTVSPNQEFSSALSEYCDVPIDSQVLSCEPPVRSKDAARTVEEFVMDMSESMESCSRASSPAQTEAPLPSSKTEDASVVESAVTSSVEKGQVESSDGTTLSSFNSASDLPPNGHTNVCAEQVVIETKQSQSGMDMEQDSASLETSKDCGSKTMIKSADTVSAAGEKLSNDLSEKELEYLSKGIALYVRKNRKQCPHISETPTVPARLPESKDEEEYLKVLQLSVKQMKAQTAVSSEETTDIKGDNSENKCDIVEANTTAVNGQVDGEPSHGNVACPEGSNNSEDSVSPNSRSEAGEAAHQEMSHSEKEENHLQTCTASPAQAEAASGDPESKPASDAVPAETAEEDQDSDVDGEMLDIHARLQLQVLQERVTIDCEVEEVCQRCQPENTEYGEPSKRTAEDFANMRFGRKHPVFSVCSFCRRYFHSVDSLLRHQVKKHPSIQCSYFEVENGHGLETLFYPEPSTRGVLAESILLPPHHVSQESYTCTRCKLIFKQYSRLRAHILNCDPNTPTTPHTRKKKAKSNRHRFMEKMLPDSSSGSKEGNSGESSNAVRNLSFRPKSQGTVMGLRAKAFPSVTSTYKLHPPSKKEEARPSSSAAPVGRLPSTRIKTQNWKYSPPRFSSSTSKLSTSPVKVGRPQRRRNHEMRYNPAAHVRRREKTECVDIHQCQGCRLSFRTLSLLERHTKNCSGKDKILGQTPVANRLLDGPDAKKHCCHYCPKRFKYLKGVYNHYNNFCRVRAERVAGEGLSAEDKAHEEQLEASLQQQAWNKMENRDHTDVIQGRAHLHDDGTITHTRRKGGWPRGLKRSNKRRRNGWTCIKRRKPDGNISEASSSSSPSKSRSASSVVSSVHSSGSATSAAMSELEARLREPIGLDMKRKRSAKDLELHSEGPREQPQLASSKAKKVKVEDDLSQAPVIDRMDTAPPAPPRQGKQMSPDLEPPTLSPIPPVLTQDSTQGKRKRKPKKKAATHSMDSKPVEGSASLSSATPDKAEAGQSTSSSKKKGEESNSTLSVVSQLLTAPQMKVGEGMTSSLLVLEQAGQYKLVQLKIPTVVPRASGLVTVPHSAGREKNIEQKSSGSDLTGTNSISTVNEQKSLPPNFLFPPPSLESVDSSKAEGREENPVLSQETGLGENEMKTVPGICQASTDQTAGKSRKPRSRQKKKKTDDALATPTIKELFKKKKSPIRSKYPNTLKNMGAYRYEKCAVTSDTVSNSGPLAVSGVSTLASSSGCQTSASVVSSLPTGSGLAVLPPGAVLAVLPSTPILLQSPTSTPPSTSPLKSTPTTTIPLHTAVSEGKLLLLDSRSLPNLLATGSLPVAATSSPLLSPGRAAAKGDQPASRKTTAAHVKTEDSSEKTSGSLKSDEKNDLPMVQPTRLGVDIPNFLFDSAKTPDASSGDKLSESCGGQKASEETQEDGTEVTSDKITPDQPKGKSKKPKRGPPPSSSLPTTGSKVKSMTMMTSPGNHTLVSLNIPSTSPSVKAKDDHQPAVSKSEDSLTEEPEQNKSDSHVDKTDSSSSNAPQSVGEDTSKSTSMKKVTRAAKKKSMSPNKEGEDGEKGDEGEGGEGKVDTKHDTSNTPDQQDASKTPDKQTVVLNVPVVQKRGGKRSLVVTRTTAARKRTRAQTFDAAQAKPMSAPFSVTRGKHTAAAPSDASVKSASPSRSEGVEKYSRTSSCDAAGKRRSASTKDRASDDDMPLSAVAAKIKDQ